MLVLFRCWEYHQLNIIHCASCASRPDKAHRLGCKVSIMSYTISEFVMVLLIHVIFRCWEYRKLNIIHHALFPSRPDKARRLGYKAKQGYVVYHIRVRCGNRRTFGIEHDCMDSPFTSLSVFKSFILETFRTCQRSEVHHAYRHSSFYSLLNIFY